MIESAARFLSFFVRSSGRPKPGRSPIDLLFRLSRITGGEVSGGEPGAPPTLHGGREDAPWRLVLHWPYRRGDTVPSNVIRFETPLPSGPFIESWPRGSDHPGLPRTGSRVPIDTGHPGFESTWSTLCDDAGAARPLLTPDFRRTLARMTALGHGAPLRFDRFPAKVLFQKEERIDDVLVLRRFLIEAEAASGLLRAAPGPDPGSTPAQGCCPVCGTTVDSDPLRCDRCHAPHHGDCWTFNGSCAVFACGEIAPAAL